MKTKSTFKIKYEKYTLKNGLEVILHKDKTTHSVAVATLYHVGSAKESVGKWGFAHLFEHLMFQGSEHVKPNEYFSKIDELGGSFNGGTWEDGTIYYEVVPNDALEKILWMESDRMGFFINTVTDESLKREIDVIINEKKQVVDNKPYGHTEEIINKYLYAEEKHPYHHSVIGLPKDLASTSLNDVVSFYRKYYAPNNACIAICGDINEKKTKHLVEKYFGEIQRQSIELLNEQDNYYPNITQNKFVYHTDPLICMPELSIIFPGEKLYTKSVYVIDFLCSLLGNTKKSPLYKEIVINNKMSPSVSIINNSKELSGEIIFKIRAFSNSNLQEIYNSVMNVIENFQINDDELTALKSEAEFMYYDSLSSNLYKAINLAQSNIFGKSPDMIYKELEIIRSITVEDIKDAYNTFLKDKNHLAVSLLPEGSPVTNYEKAEIDDNDIVQSINSHDDVKEDFVVHRRKPKVDRNKEPKLSRIHNLKIPQIWEKQLRNGMSIKGIEDNRLPLVFFSLIIKGGCCLDPDTKSGVANLTTLLLRESTVLHSAEEFEETLKLLGASISFTARKEWLSLSGHCLSKNFSKVIDLILEIISKPAWDETDFNRIKAETISNLEQDIINPKKIAYNSFYEILYGDNPIAIPNEGKIEDVKHIKINDLQDYYAKCFSPTVSSFLVCGNVKRSSAIKSLDKFEHEWKPIEIPEPLKIDYNNTHNEKAITSIYNENAEQAVLYFGQKSLKRSDVDYIPASVVNYKLGENTSSELFKILRLQYGYTYGIYSGFFANKNFGTFVCNSSIDDKYIDDAIQIIKNIFKDYMQNYSEDDLKKSKSAMLRKLNSSYDTVASRLSILVEIASMNISTNFLEEEMDKIKKLSYQSATETICKYLNIDDMKFLILRKQPI